MAQSPGSKGKQIFYTKQVDKMWPNYRPLFFTSNILCYVHNFTFNILVRYISRHYSNLKPVKP